VKLDERVIPKQDTFFMSETKSGSSCLIFYIDARL